MAHGGFATRDEKGREAADFYRTLTSSRSNSFVFGSQSRSRQNRTNYNIARSATFLAVLSEHVPNGHHDPPVSAVLPPLVEKRRRTEASFWNSEISRVRGVIRLSPELQ